MFVWIVMSTIDLYYNKLNIDSGSQFQQPEPEPLRQIDVNDLLSKLLSTGIIKPAQTDSTNGMHTIIFHFLPLDNSFASIADLLNFK